MLTDYAAWLTRRPSLHTVCKGARDVCKSSALAMAVTLAATGGLARADFYVSTTGNDSHSGGKEQPFRTIERARDCVRQQIKQGATPRTPITVWIAGGTYHLDRTFELGGEDSGVEGAAVSYRAEPGAEVRLVGGRQIPPDAFKTVARPAILNRLDAAARGHVLQADLKALGVTNFGGIVPNGKRAELFFNDQPLTLARWPNEGFVKIVEVTRRPASGQFAALSATRSASSPTTATGPAAGPERRTSGSTDTGSGIGRTSIRRSSRSTRKNRTITLRRRTTTTAIARGSVTTPSTCWPNWTCPANGISIAGRACCTCGRRSRWRRRESSFPRWSRP